MEAIFAVLILTGAALYYAPENLRGTLLQIHHFTGIAVPIALGAHWIAGLTWVKRLGK
jgi:hypothetical protein